MAESLRTYREAVAKRVHTVCLDRNLDPNSTVETEAGCRIERFLPQLVELAHRVGAKEFAAFEAAFEQTVCIQCGNRDAQGTCPVRAEAECCLYRYLPLIYEAIHGVEADSP